MQTFRLTAGYHELIIVLRDIYLQITVITQYEGKVYREIYTEPQLPATSKYQFTSSKQMYTWLQKYKSHIDRWKVTEELVTVMFQEDNILKLGVKRLTDPGQLCTVILKEVWECRKQQWQGLSSVIQAVKKIKQTEDNKQIKPEKESKSSNEQKNQEIKQIEEQIQTLKQITNQLKSQIDNLKKIDGSSNDGPKVDQLKGQMQKMRQIVGKLSEDWKLQEAKIDQSINQITVLKNEEKGKKSEYSKQEEQLRQLRYEIQYIKKISASSHLDKIAAQMKSLAVAVNQQIKIKQYNFDPDLGLLKLMPSLKYLNNKTLKSLQDNRDYLKITSVSPLQQGKSCIRIVVLNIKNNGLIMGVCTSKVRSNLEKTAFNDVNMISINSCGYIVNCGKMASINAKIQSGDALKMIVSTVQGQIRWYCNNIQIAVTDLGFLQSQPMYPIIGLGNFCDEIELINDNNSLQKQKIQGYKEQLARLNRDFGGKTKVN